MESTNEKCFLLHSAAPHVKSKNKDGVFLSVTFKHQDNAEDISEGYIFVGSASSRPCVRNTFVLEPDSKDKQGHVIKYGDCLYVRLAASQRDLYLSCEVKKFHSDVGGSDFVRPVLTRKNNYCRFVWLKCKEVSLAVAKSFIKHIRDFLFVWCLCRRISGRDVRLRSLLFSLTQDLYSFRWVPNHQALILFK